MSLVTISNFPIFKQYENANNANFGSFEKPLLQQPCDWRKRTAAA